MNSGFSIRSDSSGPSNVTVRDGLVTTGGADALAAVWLLSQTGQPIVFNAFGSTFIARGNGRAGVYAQRAADRAGSGAGR